MDQQAEKLYRLVKKAMDQEPAALNDQMSRLDQMGLLPRKHGGDGTEGADISDSGREPGNENASTIPDQRDGVEGNAGSQEVLGENDDVRLAESTGGTSGKEVIASEGQVHYKPESTGGEIGTLVAANMSKPLQDALKRLADQHGNVVEFVVVSATVLLRLLFGQVFSLLESSFL